MRSSMEFPAVFDGFSVDCGVVSISFSALLRLLVAILGEESQNLNLNLTICTCCC